MTVKQRVVIIPGDILSFVPTVSIVSFYTVVKMPVLCLRPFSIICILDEPIMFPYNDLHVTYITQLLIAITATRNCDLYRSLYDTNAI